jgi:dipeptidyl aminopeptidase/acylaminoacyl peptidase
MTSITRWATCTAVALVAGLCSMPAVGQDASPQSAGWTPAEMMKVKGVGDVQVSSNGRQVVYTVTEAVMTDDKSEYLTQIYLANTDGSGGRQITFGDKSNSNPQWSPDGRVIAFASGRSGKRNIWLLSIDGGEAQQLTDVKTGVGQFKWSPTGEQIAFLMPDPPSDAEEKANKGKSDAKVVDNNFKLTRLWLVPIARDSNGRREARLLAKEDFTIGHVVFGSHNFNWSPDGRSIVFVHMLRPRYEDLFMAQVSTVDVATASVRPLVPAMSAMRQPIWSPDGRWIAYLAIDPGARYYFSIWNVMVVPANGGSPRKLADTFDRLGWLGGGHLIGWSADSRAIYFRETVGTGSRIAALPLDGRPPRDIEKRQGAIYGVSLSASGTMLGFTSESTTRPPEAYVARPDHFDAVQVSRANASLPAHPLGRSEVIRWKSSDGLEIEGLLTYPARHEPGKRYPLALMIHGGPTGVFKQWFDASPDVYPVAAFAARGYAVLRPNPRGSAGYGKAFRVAIAKELGGMDFQDVMSGVDHVIRIGVADPDRLGVMGWSYGGYLTAWTITQTPRFKAASIGAGVVSLTSQTGTTDIPSWAPDYLGVEHWQDPTLYRERSPISHIGAISTPTIVLHGENDVRVPISQGYEFYSALKRRDLPATMVTYPRMPHWPEEPKQMLDIATRNLEWFDRYLRVGAQAEHR